MFVGALKGSSTDCAPASQSDSGWTAFKKRFKIPGFDTNT